MITFTDIVKELKPVTFKFKDSEKTSFGFIAQDLLEVFNDQEFTVVGTSEDGMYNVNYIEFIPILTRALQGLIKRVEQLEEKCHLHQK